MPNWTEEQLTVINSPAREILCSAAAGSGKTAVLVERVVRMLREGCDPSAFLVVTFTKAAASEMKEKIKTRLENDETGDENIRRALDLADVMQISTFHSFCQTLMKQYFHALKIDPRFGIADSREQDRLFHQAFIGACNELEKEQNTEYASFRKSFEHDEAEKLVRSLHDFIVTLPDPFGWLDGKIDETEKLETGDHPWFALLGEMTREHLRKAEILLHRQYVLFDEPEAIESFKDTWKKDSQLFHVKQSCAEHPGEAFAPASFSRMKPFSKGTPLELDWKARYADLRDQLKKEIGEVDRLLAADRESLKKEWSVIRSDLRHLRELTFRTTRLYQAAKWERNRVDFHDMEQETLRVLRNPDFRDSIRRTYPYLFVDECQDISGAQDALIQALHGENGYLFMVGDVKQSIYRFRLADPSLFMRRMEEYSASENPDRVCLRLQKNFRSRPEILEAANMVFSDVMRKSVAEIDYTEKEALVPGRVTEGFVPVCADILENDSKAYDSWSALADHLTHQMRALRETDYPGKDRKFTWRDCMILMPTVKTGGPLLAEYLRRRDVPVYFDGGPEYFQLEEIQVFRNFLEWIDRPGQDLPLISVLLHHPFRFTENELAKIRTESPEKDVSFRQAFEIMAATDTPLGRKCARVEEKRRRWKEMAEFFDLPEYVFWLMNESGYYHTLALSPEGNLKQANLRMLAEQAVQARKNGVMTLRGFLNFMKERVSGGDLKTATLLGQKDDVARIMTMHKSKGLQFPVVFCVHMDVLSEKNDTEKLELHAGLGVCLPYKDPAHRISRPTVIHELFAWQKERDERAEKIRLLYVAMTRAQEKMFLVTEKAADPIWDLPQGEHRVAAAGGYMDWVMPTVLASKKSTGYSQPYSPFILRNFDCNQQKIVENRENIHNLQNWFDSLMSQSLVEELWKDDSGKAAPGPDESPLEKRSVTDLIRSARMAVEPEEETPATKREPEGYRRKFTAEALRPRPAFMEPREEYAGARRGTLIHRMLSLPDPAALRRVMGLPEIADGIVPKGFKPDKPGLEAFLEAEIERLRDRKVFTEEEAALIPVSGLVKFYASKLGIRMLCATVARREWNFNYLVRGEKPFILQGVIDCAFLEGDQWVLVDYKTDRVKDEAEFIEAYRPQLEWYAAALEGMTGKKVREKILYAISRGKVFPVTDK